METSHSLRANKHLRRERIGRDWRQRDLAEQLGTTVDTVKRWERGSQQPGPYFRVKLCALFGKSAAELGLLPDEQPLTKEEVSSTEQASLSPADSLALWTVPYRRNPHFTGRDELLEHLARQLSCEKQSAATLRRAILSQAQAVKGLGGIGKTQIALEYAYRSREQDRYTHILWLNAASEEAILTSFQMLAERLPNFVDKAQKDQRQLIAAILHWLEACSDPWLLIMDNADELALVQPYLPQQGLGSILLTTRATAVGWLAHSMEVEQMGLTEGTQFLLHRTQCLDPSDEQYNEATNIVIALDGFPLALDQAGAYIEETRCSFGGYLQLYKRHRAILLARRGKQASHYPNSVATTWSLSFQKIEQTHPAAAELLRLCSFLSPDHVPEELLTGGVAHWPPMLQDALADPLGFNELLEILQAFSLVKRLSQEHLLSLHRLVQAVLLDRMDPELQRSWAKRVVCAVNTIFPVNPQEDVKVWPFCQRYLEQVQACDALIQHYQLQFLEAAQLLNRAGMYLHEHASYDLAEPLFQRALAMAEQQLGPEHDLVASSLNSLGNLYRAQGQYEQAEPLLQRALVIWERTVGPDHARLASPLTFLGLLYWQQGKSKQAEPLLQRALAIWEQTLGPHHARLAFPLNNLGNLYCEQGQYEQAELLYQRALGIWEQTLGPDHPHAAFPLNNLGFLYREQGKYEQAEPLLLRALHIREQTLGPEHPELAFPLNNLGNLYREQGKYEQAEPLLHRALHIWEQIGGPEYPELPSPLINLGHISFKRGQYEQAEALLQRALHICEQAVGPEHHRMVEPLNELAHLYRDQGKYQQADVLYQRALSLRQAPLGQEHRDVAETLQGLAWLRQMQLRPTEAFSLYQRTLAIRERIMGVRHPKTCETRERLRAVLNALGKTP
jgi:tetratricopeptide (TPR) repeat protein